MTFNDALVACPIVAILRGITPPEAPAIGEALLSAGITLMEVPLNSPDPLSSISALLNITKGDALVGAGTVLTASAAADVARIGGQMIIAPNLSVGVGKAAQDTQVDWVPGVLTPTEAFCALEAGASAIKLFPAEMASPRVVKALRAVLPKETSIIVVGGVDTNNIADYRAAGATGFGIGSSLYSPGDTAQVVEERARQFINAAQ